MKISFVIPAYNEERYLGACLNSVLRAIREFKAAAHGGAHEFEIIVVNNASSDRTGAIAAGYAEVAVVDEPEKGLPRARQAGFLRATGDLLAYIDADTVLPPGWIGKALREFSSNPRLVSLSGPFRYHDLSLPKKLAAEALWSVFAMPVYACTRYMILGANFVVRRRALERIGGFNTRIAFYGEDTDLARRLRAEGRVKFRTDFFIYGSGRRLAKGGFVATETRYGLNFLWEALFKKPLTREYRDIR